MRRSGSTIQRKCNLTPEMDAKVNLLLLDTKRNKPRYGGFSHLVEHLLTQYFIKLEQTTKDI